MSILPEKFWHYRFIFPNNLFKPSVFRLLFMDILRPSMRVVICVLTVYFIYLSVAGPDLQIMGGGGHPDLELRGGWFPKYFFRPFRRQF